MRGTGKFRSKSLWNSCRVMDWAAFWFSAPGAFQNEEREAPVNLNGPYWAAFIPSQIEAGDGFNPVLEGFPLNLLFGGFTIDAQSGRLSSLDVCYEPAPETFRENSRRKEMRYFKKTRNVYWIHGIFDKKTGEWQTKKAGSSFE